MTAPMHLTWPNCLNVRDLGGLPTTDGRQITAGAGLVLTTPADQGRGERLRRSARSGFRLAGGRAAFQLAGSGATIALGRGSYELTCSAKTSTIRTVDGEQAVVTVSVNGTPITLTVGQGGSVTYTEASANGRVTGLTGIQRAGTVGVRADSMPATACAGIAIQNVIVATTGNDQISGTGGNDLIVGRGGNDTVNGNGGSDCVTTGSGNDQITTTGGDDWIGCGAGSDAAQAGGGSNANVGNQCETFGT